MTTEGMRGDSRNHLDRAGEIGNYLGSVYEGLGTYAKDADLGGSIKKLGTGAGTAFSVIDRAQDGFTIRDGVAVGAGVAGGSFGAYLGAAVGTFFFPGVGTAIGAAAGSLLGGQLGEDVVDNWGSHIPADQRMNWNRAQVGFSKEYLDAVLGSPPQWYSADRKMIDALVHGNQQTAAKQAMKIDRTPGVINPTDVYQEGVLRKAAGYGDTQSGSNKPSGSQGNGLGPSNPSDPRGPWQMPGSSSGNSAGPSMPSTTPAPASSTGASSAPSVKTVAADPGGFGLGPGSRDGGNSMGASSSPSNPSSSPTVKSGDSSGLSSANTGRSDRDQQGGVGTRLTQSAPSGVSTGNMARSTGRADRDQQGSSSPFRSSPSASSKPSSTSSGSSSKDKSSGNRRPVLLDLEGNGIRVSEFSDSTIYADIGNDGLKRCTASMISGKPVLENAERRANFVGCFSAIAATLTILMCQLPFAALADDPLNFDANRVIHMLEILPKDGVIAFRELVPNDGAQKFCLISNDTHMMLDVEGCNVSVPSLLSVSKSGECTMIDLSSLNSRILSGSIETECRPVSPSLALTKLNQFGQEHIVFAKE